MPNPNPPQPPSPTPVPHLRPLEMKQFRGRKASLWQSAVDQVISKRGGSEPVKSQGAPTGKMRLKRPDQSLSLIHI